MRRIFEFVLCWLAIFGPAAGLGWAAPCELKLTAADAAPFDLFGESVCTSGDTAIVGAYRDDAPSANAGSAYIFVRSGTGWSQNAKLTASDATPTAEFGGTVSISGDTAVVGAHFADGAFLDDGAAYVFEKPERGWSDMTETVKLTAADAAPADWFGMSVAIEGDTAVVGAMRDDGPAANEQGSAYVFVRSGSTWVLQAKLTASDSGEADWFGGAVAISGDTAVICAFRDDDVAGADVGSAYVFVRQGSSWSQQAKLRASDGAAGDWFGIALAVAGDTAVVGARYDDGPAGGDQGSAYVFVRSGSIWSQEAKLTASDSTPFAEFGDSVSIHGDTVVVGARFDDGTYLNQGSVYVYVKPSDGWSDMTQTLQFTASDGAEYDWFGDSVYIEGDTLLVGARHNDGPAAPDRGAAYVLALNLNADSDLLDFAAFQACFIGAGGPPVPDGCDIVDFNCDEDVDLVDYAAFVASFTGP